jgi:serine/threonine protein phosphatase PrpC
VLQWLTFIQGQGRSPRHLILDPTDEKNNNNNNNNNDDKRGVDRTTRTREKRRRRFAIMGNIGDSRAVLSRGGRAVELTEDHKPNLPHKKARVKAFDR